MTLIFFSRKYFYSSSSTFSPGAFELDSPPLPVSRFSYENCSASSLSSSLSSEAEPLSPEPSLEPSSPSLSSFFFFLVSLPASSSNSSSSSSSDGSKSTCSSSNSLSSSPRSEERRVGKEC